MKFIKIKDPESNIEAYVEIGEIMCIMPAYPIGSKNITSRIYFKRREMHICAKEPPNEIMDKIEKWRNNKP